MLVQSRMWGGEFLLYQSDYKNTFGLYKSESEGSCLESVSAATEMGDEHTNVSNDDDEDNVIDGWVTVTTNNVKVWEF